MFKDDVVDEVRKTRQKIYKECHNDLDTYFAMLNKVGAEFEKESAEILSQKPKKPRRKKAA
ncbi:MAG TPA: hypothetical protein DC017_13855 [Candidatus Wallbacteria bacterium]|nr:hypothetical protein [Candidatus Wallbacteria bacterium]